MKWFVVVLFGLIVFNFSEAATLKITKSTLGTPFYRTISKLNFISEVAENGVVSVKFLDRTDRQLEIHDGIKIKKSDWSDCSLGKCLDNFYEFPLAIEKHSCSVEIRFSSQAGQIISSTRERWGDCVILPPLPDVKYLPDFVFSEDAYFSNESAIDLLNIGSNYIQKSLSIWGILKDANGHIIWSGVQSSLVTFNSQDILTVNFQSTPKTWQTHLSCTGEFFINPESDSFERSKLNNSVKVEFGNCENVPSEAAGDRIDLLPSIDLKNGMLFFQASNLGRLPYLDETTKIETYIRYYDQNHQIIYSRDVFTSPAIYGFGDSKEIETSPIPEGTCAIEVELNPNLTLKESNYNNNKIELNVCE